MSNQGNNLATIVIGDENHIGVSGALAMSIIEAYFGQRSPARSFRKKEVCGMVSNNPVLTKSNRAGNDRFVLMIDAAHAKRILCRILCAIWHVVAERAETTRTVSFRAVGLISDQIIEDFCSWLSTLAHEHISLSNVLTVGFSGSGGAGKPPLPALTSAGSRR